MKLSNETKVGILSVVSILILFIGYKFLKGEDIFKSQNFFYAEYPNINGLGSNSQVVLNGLPIGKVHALTLNRQNNNSIVAKIGVDKSIFIPVNSNAEIISADLLGTKEIAIIFSDSSQLAQSGDTLIGSIESNLQDQVSATILPVQQKAKELLGSMDTMIQVIGLIFNERNRKHIDSSLYSFYNALETMSNTAEQIDTVVASETQRLKQIFSNVESITGNIRENNKALAEMLKNISAITDSVQKADITRTINNARKSLKEFSEMAKKINNGEGSIGLLLNDKELYDNLARSSASMDSLLSDLKNNPNRYVHVSVFGRKDKKSKKKKKKWGE